MTRGFLSPKIVSSVDVENTETSDQFHSPVIAPAVAYFFAAVAVAA